MTPVCAISWLMVIGAGLFVVYLVLAPLHWAFVVRPMATPKGRAIGKGKRNAP